MMAPDFNAPDVTLRMHGNQIETVERHSTAIRIPHTRHATPLASARRTPRINYAPGSAPSSATCRLGVANESWRLGLVTDRKGRIHLGVVVADTDDCQPGFIDLLAAVGAAEITNSDLDHITVLVRGEQMASVQRIIEQCIDNNRLRSRLLELLACSTAQWETTT